MMLLTNCIGKLWVRQLLFLALGIVLIPGNLWATEDSLCFECHSDKELVKVDESGREVSLYLDKGNWENSVHAAISCVGCHTDLDGTEAEHAAKLGTSPPI